MLKHQGGLAERPRITMAAKPENRYSRETVLDS